jgi:hypothetical protein
MFAELDMDKTKKSLLMISSYRKSQLESQNSWSNKSFPGVDSMIMKKVKTNVASGFTGETFCIKFGETEEYKSAVIDN